ncbi:hypothetical protein SAMN05421676_11042 [Salinibacillus kushneri]|uniref:Uncharacterized protein n=1 Tax=Salinibacillus kushneri TaxID=237682 RepID=A0A1I0HXK9_9BACI|nr:hypothetical protein [Salinibacillus kushneri]SET89024.1 hypothetical protein SAMN05421676_11042 [Salinibacillus kushneri]
MEIKGFKGRQLEKSVPASPEDGFIRSEVAYIDNGFEKEFHMVYLEYFDQKFSEVTPYENNPIISFHNYRYEFKDVAALAVLLTYPQYKHQKRLYVPDWDQFVSLLNQVQWNTVETIIQEESQEYLNQ